MRTSSARSRSAARLPDGVECIAYSAPMVVDGGTAPFTWSTTSGSLPPGLTLAADGSITGTPTAGRRVHLHGPGRRLDRAHRHPRGDDRDRARLRPAAVHSSAVHAAAYSSAAVHAAALDRCSRTVQRQKLPVLRRFSLAIPATEPTSTVTVTAWGASSRPRPLPPRRPRWPTAAGRVSSSPGSHSD